MSGVAGAARPGEKTMTTHTLSAWNGPGSPAAQRRSRYVLLGAIAAGLVVVALGGVGIVAIATHGSPAPSSQTAAIGEPHATATSTANGTATTTTATVTATATTTATSDAIPIGALPTATTATTATHGTTKATATASAKPLPSAKPTGTKNDDDLPTSRR